MTSSPDQDHVAAGNGGGVATLDPDELPTAAPRTVPWLRIGVIAALIVVAIVLAYLRAGSGVVVVQAVTTGILIGGVYGLVAMGLTLIFGVLDIVNFAHGSFLALALFLTFGLTQAGLHVYLALAVSVPAMFLLGVLVQRGILAGAMGKPLENQLLITLGISLIIENALLLFFGANPRSVALSGDRGVPIFEAVANLSRHPRLRRRAAPRRPALPAAAAHPPRHRHPRGGRQRHRRAARRHRHPA